MSFSSYELDQQEVKIQEQLLQLTTLGIVKEPIFKSFVNDLTRTYDGEYQRIQKEIQKLQEQISIFKGKAAACYHKREDITRLLDVYLSNELKARDNRTNREKLSGIAPPTLAELTVPDRWPKQAYHDFVKLVDMYIEKNGKVKYFLDALIKVKDIDPSPWDQDFVNYLQSKRDLLPATIARWVNKL